MGLPLRMLYDCFKSRRRLEAEVLVLRHQLNVLQQRAPRRVQLRSIDRALFVWLYRFCPYILSSVTIVKPETVVRWHRMGFAAYWRWTSRPRGGRPRICKETRDLIRRMSLGRALHSRPPARDTTARPDCHVGLPTYQAHPRASVPSWGGSGSGASVRAGGEIEGIQQVIRSPPDRFHGVARPCDLIPDDFRPRRRPPRPGRKRPPFGRCLRPW